MVKHSSNQKDLLGIHADEVFLRSNILMSSTGQGILKEFTFHDFLDLVIFHPLCSIIRPDVFDFSTVLSMEKT